MSVTNVSSNVTFGITKSEILVREVTIQSRKRYFNANKLAN